MKDIPSFWGKSEKVLYSSLESKNTGLTTDEASERLQMVGKNTLETSQNNSPFLLFLNQFKSPITIILIFATIISALLKDVTTATIILVIVMLSALLSFRQEYNASNAVSALLNIVRVKTTALRDGKLSEIPVEEVVPGDILHLSNGDVVPADCYILEANALSADESTLTGETFPVEKAAGILKDDTPLNNRTNVLWMGTHVTNGEGKVLVVQTAKATEFGKIYKRLSRRVEETDFEKGVRKFGNMLMEITFLLIFAIFAINVALNKPIFDSFLFSLALAVGLTPQLLPAIISVNLSHGAKAMAEKKVIVKKLSSNENFGSMNLLCSDKTGTITQGTVQVNKASDLFGNDNQKVFLLAALNANFQSGYANPIDGAILSDNEMPLDGYTKLGEVPYSFVDKTIRVLLKTPDGSDFSNKHLVVAKGALDNILARCSDVMMSDGSVKSLKDAGDSVQKIFEHFSEQGFRTLGIAAKTGDDTADLLNSNELTFYGFLTLHDPLKEGMIDTVLRLKELGVDLKIITGDNRLIAKHIADELKLPGQEVLTGSDIKEMSDGALLHHALRTSIFAEIEPNQKERIVNVLKKGNNVIGYMGDGINDASAIHAADVGISVDTAADVAKDAADIVLLEKSLDVLTEGVLAGRRTFANTMKYVFMATSANFGNMFSMAGASLFLPFLPLLPMQILLTNLLQDFPEMQIANDNVDEEQLQQPQRWSIPFIRKFMVVFGLLSSVFDYATFGVLYLIFKSQEQLFQTGWFVESVLSATFIIFVIRTRQSITKSYPGKGLAIAIFTVGLLVLSLPFTPIAGYLHFTPLPWSIVLAIIAIVVTYLVVGEGVKKIFYKWIMRSKTI